jgi:hypothetical protein
MSDTDAVFETVREALTDLEGKVGEMEDKFDDFYAVIESLMDFVGDVFPDDERWMQWKSIRDDVEALESGGRV